MAEDTLRALARDIASLAANTALDRESDPNRVLPEIAPAQLWRVYPRILRAVAPHMPTATDADFARNLASAIEDRCARKAVRDA